MICPNQHCSICKSGAMFEVFRARKWEALCEDHFLWLMDNVRKLPEFRRMHAIVCFCGEGRPPHKKRDRSAYRQVWYDKNRERVLAKAKEQREARYTQIMSETVSTHVH